jgi:radical SAM superfamily enzyme YgiQ (UPF0313 family)
MYSEEEFMSKGNANSETKKVDKNRLDLLLINPSLNWKFDQEKKITLRIEEDIPNQESPHLGVAYLLAIAKRNGIRAKYIDMVMDAFYVDQIIDYVKQTNPSLVGFTSFTYQVRTSASIAASIKNSLPHITTCIGGPHATALPKETLKEFPEFDFVVCGEAEKLLPKIFEIIENERSLKKLDKLDGVATRTKVDISRFFPEDLDDLPFPAWEEFGLSKYPGASPHRRRLELPMITSRGCPYRCTFCCRVLGDTVRRRSVSSVIAEIERNVEEFGCEAIAFLDETFVLSKKWADEFFTTLIERGLNKKIIWSCSTTVSNFSLELARQMRAAGCYYVFFGFESADDEILKRIKKNTTAEQTRNAVKFARQGGLLPVGSFIIGLPGDTKEHIFKTIEMARELNCYSVTFPLAVPFPGTEMREMALRNEYGMRIISNNWDHYGKHASGVLESVELPWSMRQELQGIAYKRNPKHKLDDYLQELEELSGSLD